LLLKTEDAEGFLRELDKRKVPYSRWDVYL